METTNTKACLSAMRSTTDDTYMLGYSFIGDENKQYIKGNAISLILTGFIMVPVHACIQRIHMIRCNDNCSIIDTYTLHMHPW